MSQITAHDLRKTYRGRVAVAGVSLEVLPGEIVGLLGPNGAGKTTCFYMIVGLEQPDSGSVAIDGTDVTELGVPDRARLGLGYLPQEASVFRKLSVEDNLRAILETRRELSRDAQNKRLERLLSELHIGHIRGSQGAALSGGERRRVEIARALVIEPRFMLLDEPFAGVDPITVIDIQRIIRELAARGIGVLITDHNVRETLGICHRAYIVNEGEVLAAGSPERILDDDRVRAVYLGDAFRL
ncbi:MAG: LPS export ABC transporter ATP-binding protein [Immundisolibacter sp.]|uniref:LPS export ABC transporter ATP-binding protein n=1 Tax=Immundisolibacter sp. TaxID=1934948 RepID=UPI003EE347CC